MAIIGLSKLHYARMTTEDTATTAPVYETPKRLIGVNSVSISPENDTATLYGDNMALDSKSSTRQRTITLEIARLSPEDQAALLGYEYDSSTKKMSVNGDAAAPNVAIMYELDTDEGKKWYYVFYKGKFAPSNEDANTRGDSLEYGLHSIEGTFVARIDNGLVYEIKEADATDTTTATSWYGTVGGGA